MHRLKAFLALFVCAILSVIMVTSSTANQEEAEEESQLPPAVNVEYPALLDGFSKLYETLTGRPMSESLPSSGVSYPSKQLGFPAYPANIEDGDHSDIAEANEAQKHRLLVDNLNYSTSANNSGRVSAVSMPISGNFSEAMKTISTLLVQKNIGPDNDDSPFVAGVTNKDHIEFLIKMLVNPSPTENDKRFEWDPRSEDGIAKWVNYYAQHAVLALARNSLLDLYNIRKGNLGSEGKSIMQLMEEGAKTRYQSTEWNDKIANASPPEALRELTQMESFRLWMDYHKFLQMEKVEALLAVALSNVISPSGTSGQLAVEVSEKLEEGEAKAEEMESEYNERSKGFFQTN